MDVHCRFCGDPCYVRQVPVSIPYSDAYCDKPGCVQQMRHLCLPALLLRYLGSLAVQQYCYEQNPTPGEARMVKLLETEVANVRQEMQEYHLIERSVEETEEYVRIALQQYKEFANRPIA